jgi:hypothetical protein
MSPISIELAWNHGYDAIIVESILLSSEKIDELNRKNMFDNFVLLYVYPIPIGFAVGLGAMMRPALSQPM